MDPDTIGCKDEGDAKGKRAGGRGKKTMEMCTMESKRWNDKIAFVV